MNLLSRFVTAALVALMLASLVLPNAHAVTIDMVTVGDPGNTADTTGYGAVMEEFRIGKYEVTIGQYTEFLNAVAKSDPYGLYDEYMATRANISGISRSGSNGSYSYSVIGPFGVVQLPQATAANRPIGFISWFDAARFANWMHNGQSSGSTETGAYELNGAISGTAPARIAGAQFYIPSDNEWYKAAYYKGGGGNAGYWTFATQSDAVPGKMIGGASNQANWGDAVTQAGPYDRDQNYLTDVGAFSGSPSAYGTFDQNGNVTEWTDRVGLLHPLRGGSSASDWLDLRSSYRPMSDPSLYYAISGFRLAAPVPEPSTWVMGLAGIACGGWGAWRRKRA